GGGGLGCPSSCRRIAAVDLEASTGPPLEFFRRRPKVCRTGSESQGWALGRAPMSGKILFVSNDVFFWARVQGLAKTLGRDAVRIGDDAEMEAAFRTGGVARVIVDLGSRAIDARAWASRWKEASPAPQ